MKLFLFFLWAVLFHLPLSQAQEINWENTFSDTFPSLGLVDFDNEDNLFFSDQKGNVTVRYNLTADSSNNYSPAYQGSLQQLEAAKTVNIFTFSRDLQRIELLDRFLNPLYSSRLNAPEFGNIRAASLGNNLKIWLFDETNYHLIQWDYQRSTVLQDQPLNLLIADGEWTVEEIVEYKNTVFINVQNKGIYLLDNQSNFIGFLPIITHQKLAFHSNFLLHMDEEILVITDYLSGKSKKVKAPVKAPAVAIGKSVMSFYSKGRLDTYTIPDNLFEWTK
ncbi:hypothetical protein [Echinicola vietnamensis]|uniref:Uncharacterized protein n=1 Tax=Echinicola vietnamensis (strain DSM 17526 / LMG 23754 / KMM 6221) TaxID=926556 RepID=L0FZE7_ECHVK|nr:hypothetical protein [Echinicola vietnamensis]AGA78672.1 hypothetical protein Echvi_2425 [Echinicola vietnamensis DSM 17526]